MTNDGAFTLRLRYVTIRTHDLEQSREFYERVLRLDTTADRNHVKVDTGSPVQLCLDLPDDRNSPEPLLVFTVNDLNACVDILRASGVEIDRHSDDSPYFMLTDRDGNLIAIEEE